MMMMIKYISYCDYAYLVTMITDVGD